MASTRRNACKNSGLILRSNFHEALLNVGTGLFRITFSVFRRKPNLKP